MGRHRVVCLTSPGSTATEIEVEREILAASGAEVELGMAETEAETLMAVRDADGILHRGGCLTAAVIGHLERCRIIAHGGVGYDAVDLAAASAQGIAVTNVADYCIDEVSDHAILLLMALSRRLLSYAGHVHAGRWLPQGAGVIRRLGEQTVAVVGYGRIGSAFGRKALALGLRVLAVDPYVDSAYLSRHGVDRWTLAAALPEADFFSLHVPLTAGTRHLFGVDQFRHMKPTAYLINTARGGVVDEPALLTALTAGWIAGAGLDVLEQEPPTPDHPLLRLDNVIVTPHAAYYSEASVCDVRQMMAHQVAAVLNGGRPRFLLNPDVFERPAPPLSAAARQEVGARGND